MVILMRMQHLNPETKETLVNRAHREKLVPRVFKYLLDLKDDKDNREHLETKALFRRTRCQGNSVSCDVNYK